MVIEFEPVIPRCGGGKVFENPVLTQTLYYKLLSSTIACCILKATKFDCCFKYGASIQGASASSLVALCASDKYANDSL